MQDKQHTKMEIKNKLPSQKCSNIQSIMRVQMNKNKKKLKQLSGCHQFFHVPCRIINKILKSIFVNSNLKNIYAHV